MGMFAYQIIQNIGMTVAVIPVTGVTLPFISYGGSSFTYIISKLRISIKCWYEKKENKLLNNSEGNMNIALIAHDKMKDTMIGFCIAYEDILRKIWIYMQLELQVKRIMDETWIKYK